MVTNCFIVEDEENSQEILKRFLIDYCKDMKVVGMAKAIEEAEEKIRELSPDIVFLDIELEDGVGFDLISKFSPFDFITIFITGYEHYSVEAVKYMAVDYLLKPLSINKIQEAVIRAKDRLRAWKVMKFVDVDSNNSIRNTLDDKIVLKNGRATVIIEPHSINFISVDNPYCRIHAKNKKNPILIHNTLSKVSEKLPDYFFKVHRSYIVNLKQVISWDKGRGGHLTMSDQTHLPIAIRQKKEFKLRINAINL